MKDMYEEIFGEEAERERAQYHAEKAQKAAMKKKEEEKWNRIFAEKRRIAQCYYILNKIDHEGPI